MSPWENETLRVIDFLEQERAFEVRFSYDVACRQAVASVEGAYFDSNSRSWKVPWTRGKELLIHLDHLHFKLTPGAREVLLDGGGTSGTTTVSQLNRQLAQVVQESFQEPIWLECELVGWTKIRPRGHAYFELVERHRDGTVSAKIAAVLWNDDRIRLTQSLASIGHELKDGGTYRFLVQPGVYVKTGGLSVSIKDIDLESLGSDAELRRTKILAELSKRGDLDTNRKMAIPRVPLRVALITGRSTDAEADFLDELRRSGFAFSVGVFYAKMQGVALEESVMDGLIRFAELRDDYDILVITRGGGSVSDLGWFDSFKLGLGAMRFPLPVLTGIGHHRDLTVMDRVTRGFKTPTAVAQFLVDTVSNQERTLDDLARRIQTGARRHLDSNDRVLDRFGTQLEAHAKLKCEREEGSIQRAQTRLSTSLRQYFERTSARLDLLESKVESENPRRSLERGFVLLRAKGKVQSSVGDLEVGQDVELEFGDGSVLSRVLEITKHGER